MCGIDRLQAASAPYETYIDHEDIILSVHSGNIADLSDPGSLDRLSHAMGARDADTISSVMAGSYRSRRGGARASSRSSAAPRCCASAACASRGRAARVGVEQHGHRQPVLRPEPRQHRVGPLEQDVLEAVLTEARKGLPALSVVLRPA